MVTSGFRVGRLFSSSTFVTACILTAASVGATHYLATAQLGADGGLTVAQRIALRRMDPETTGSLSSRANTTRLDPCRAAARFPADP